MGKKVILYWNTIRYLKFNQIFFRVKKIVMSKFRHRRGVFSDIPSLNKKNPIILPELDSDPDYLKRFQLNDILNNKFFFIGQTVKIDLASGWNNAELSQLWRFNLHYFEYVYALGYAYQTQKDIVYYYKYKELIKSWIDNNSEYAGDGWHPYTISLRVVNWICSYRMFEELIDADTEFNISLLRSIYFQYVYLKDNPEKDILGNHYIENLKALIAGSIFFQEHNKVREFTDELERQLKEQIHNDGMHFELSPMYHKIMIEALLKIGFWLNNYDSQFCACISKYLGLMLNCLYSLEYDMGKTPFFNDSADGVSKTLSSLLIAADKYFGLKPAYKDTFAQSGYYILESENKKLIVDCGKIGPDYLPGHGHCDALSYELSVNKQPFIVNSGTYEYKSGQWREFFRSTRAHNTVMIGESEQSQCWSSFRVAKRIYKNGGELVSFNGNRLFKGSYFNYQHEKHMRWIFFVNPDILMVIDKVISNKTRNYRNYIHFHPDLRLEKKAYWEVWRTKHQLAQIITLNALEQNQYNGGITNGWYSPEFGVIHKNHVLELMGSCDSLYSGYIIDFSNSNINFETNSEYIRLEIENSVKTIYLKDMGL